MRGMTADSSTSTRPQDKLIVIIDDDDSVRELLEFLVRKEGFAVDNRRRRGRKAWIRSTS